MTTTKTHEQTKCKNTQTMEMKMKPTANITARPNIHNVQSTNKQDGTISATSHETN